MPAKSKEQQKFMGMVHAAQQGEKAASPEVAQAAKGMSKQSAKDFASTSQKGLPEHKGDRKHQAKPKVHMIDSEIKHMK